MENFNLIRDKILENDIKNKLWKNYFKNEKIKKLEELDEMNIKNNINHDVSEHMMQRWMPDYLVKNCLCCTKKFGMFLSKYHCCLCGDVFCSDCLMNELIHPFKEKMKSCFNCNIKMKVKYYK